MTAAELEGKVDRLIRECIADPAAGMRMDPGARLHADLGLDSMGFLKLIAGLEETFGFVVSPDFIPDMEQATVGEVLRKTCAEMEMVDAKTK